MDSEDDSKNRRLFFIFYVVISIGTVQFAMVSCGPLWFIVFVVVISHIDACLCISLGTFLILNVATELVSEIM